MSRGTPKEALTEEETAWFVDAGCLGVDPALFFPGRGEDSRAAKQVCAGCVVRRECFTYAMTHGEVYGVWGGHSERVRRRLRTWWREGMAVPPVDVLSGGAGRPRKDVVA